MPSIYITGLNRVERNEMIIKNFELIALCKVLNISYDDLMNAIK